MMDKIKHGWIWLKRFRYRCGYGVHSPFAFDFITNVIYEKGSYYAYRALERPENEPTRANQANGRRRKINRLLFRLVNYVQPSVIIDAGVQDQSSLYLRAGKQGARYVSLPPLADMPRCADGSTLFIYIHSPAARAHDIIENYMMGMNGRALMVIDGLYRSASMKSLWQSVVTDRRVGVTFDLYDVGILFFDKTKIKQHYTVNF